MSIIEILILAIGVSMDAFAVSVINGLSIKKGFNSVYISNPFTFGLFQGTMITMGFAVGQLFASFIEQYDHVIAFVLLAAIGGKMIYDSLHEDYNNEENNRKLSFGMLMFQGVATSIDALAVGVSLSVIRVNIVFSAAVIASVTALISLAGVIIGRRFGNILGAKSEIAGGIILIFIGLKIFISHIAA